MDLISNLYGYTTEEEKGCACAEWTKFTQAWALFPTTLVSTLNCHSVVAYLRSTNTKIIANLFDVSESTARRIVGQVIPNLYNVLRQAKLISFPEWYYIKHSNNLILMFPTNQN